jgi:hypothetical protein
MLDRPVVLVVQSLTVQGEASHTQRPDYFYPVVQAVEVALLAQGATSQRQHLRPLS